VDRRHGKRPLPSDHASRENREGFNFPSQQGEEEPSSFPFVQHPINTADDSTPSTYGQIPTSTLIETQDPSQHPLNQGKKFARFMHYLYIFQFIYSSMSYYATLFVKDFTRITFCSPFSTPHISI